MQWHWNLTRNGNGLSRENCNSCPAGPKPWLTMTHLRKPTLDFCQSRLVLQRLPSAFSLLWEVSKTSVPSSLWQSNAHGCPKMQSTIFNNCQIFQGAFSWLQQSNTFQIFPNSKVSWIRGPQLTMSHTNLWPYPPKRKLSQLYVPEEVCFTAQGALSPFLGCSGQRSVKPSMAFRRPAGVGVKWCWRLQDIPTINKTLGLLEDSCWILNLKNLFFWYFLSGSGSDWPRIAKGLTKECSAGACWALPQNAPKQIFPQAPSALRPALFKRKTLAGGRDG